MQTISGAEAVQGSVATGDRATEDVDRRIARAVDPPCVVWRGDRRAGDHVQCRPVGHHHIAGGHAERVNAAVVIRVNGPKWWRCSQDGVRSRCFRSGSVGRTTR